MNDSSDFTPEERQFIQDIIDLMHASHKRAVADLGSLLQASIDGAKEYDEGVDYMISKGIQRTIEGIYLTAFALSSGGTEAPFEVRAKFFDIIQEAIDKVYKPMALSALRVQIRENKGVH